MWQLVNTTHYIQERLLLLKRAGAQLVEVVVPDQRYNNLRQVRQAHEVDSCTCRRQVDLLIGVRFRVLDRTIATPFFFAMVTLDEIKAWARGHVYQYAVARMTASDLVGRLGRIQI